MPHLMNCEHSSEGWCLCCVSQLYNNVKHKSGFILLKTDDLMCCKEYFKYYLALKKCHIRTENIRVEVLGDLVSISIFKDNLDINGNGTKEYRDKQWEKQKDIVKNLFQQHSFHHTWRWWNDDSKRDQEDFGEKNYSPGICFYLKLMDTLDG